MKGILMTAPNHLATRKKIKTQTRRLDGLKEINEEPDKWHVNKQPAQGLPAIFHSDAQEEYRSINSHYRVGEVVYIKEAYELYRILGSETMPNKANIKYISDNLVTWATIPIGQALPKRGYHSPLFLPAWAARDFIKITKVGIGRLQDITPEECLCEGIELPIPIGCEIPSPPEAFANWDNDKREEWIKGQARATYFARCADVQDHIDAFHNLWDSINGKRNPYDSNPFCWEISYELLESK
jgi:hypothetical protein